MITYPPEMLPKAEDGADVIVCANHPNCVLTGDEREACAVIADDMATGLLERIADGEEIEPITPQQVINGYRMIAKLIRART